MTTTPIRRQFSSSSPEVAALDSSVRWPVLACFLTSVHWLVTGTFLLVYGASLRHPQNGIPILDLFTTLSQNFGAFTFGRVWAAAFHCLIYGWAGTAGMGLTLWMVTRISRIRLRKPGVVFTGVIFWNLGMASGLTSIFLGFGNGVEFLEFPVWASWMLLVAYALISYQSVLTIARTAPERFYISLQWLLVSLFAFPWLYGSATISLTHPIVGSGVAQALVSAWFSHGLFTLWLGPIAIATLYYLISKTSALPVHYYSWSGLAFWTWLFFAPWTAVHDMVGGPFPSWCVTLGLFLGGLTIFPVILICYSMITTCLQAEELSHGKSVVVQFLTLGAVFFAVTGITELVLSARPLNTLLRFTLFREADLYLWIFGFFSFTAFGAMYYVIPRLLNYGWKSPNWIKTHYYASLYGILMTIALMIFGGVLQGLKLENTDKLVTVDTSNSITLSYYISGTLCISIISIGNGVFIAHLGWLLVDRFRTLIRKNSTIAELAFERYEPDVLSESEELQTANLVEAK